LSQPFVGQVIAVGFNFAPQGWLLCQGQLVPISQYEVLYTLIGTTYGGNGTTNFQLPDLRGRTVMGMGQGPSLSNYVLGQQAGSEFVTLTQATMPPHTHTPIASTAATTATPSNTVVLAAANGTTASNQYATPTPAPSDVVLLNAATISSYPGGGQGHENRQNFQTINYIIAAFGIFPSQT